MEFHENRAKAPFIGPGATLAGGEALAAANADPTRVTADE